MYVLKVQQGGCVMGKSGTVLCVLSVMRRPRSPNGKRRTLCYKAGCDQLRYKLYGYCFIHKPVQTFTSEQLQRKKRISLLYTRSGKDKERRLKKLCRDAGITDEFYKALPQICNICGTSKPGGNSRMHIDHDHKTGKFRGLLCNRHNIALGLFQDKCEDLTRAIAYLSGVNKI